MPELRKANMKSAVAKSKLNQELTLTVLEISEAENVLIVSIQTYCFATPGPVLITDNK